MVEAVRLDVDGISFDAVDGGGTDLSEYRQVYV
jgi:hypothetical protein